MLKRDWRAGELTVLLLALLVAVASVTTVGFFAERVQRALNAQANEMLGSDLILIADHKTPEQFEAQAKQQKLTIANTLTFPSMVSMNGQSQLADIKAVTAAYPLRGNVRITDSIGTPDKIAERAPAKGEVWVAERLLSRSRARPAQNYRNRHARAGQCAGLFQHRAARDYELRRSRCDRINSNRQPCVVSFVDCR
jgi:putative ABC transport system permease protein